MKVSDVEMASALVRYAGRGTWTNWDEDAVETITDGLMERLTAAEAIVEKYKALVDAKDDLLMHLEDEMERSSFDDADLPPEVLELEQAVCVAEAALKGNK